MKLRLIFLLFVLVNLACIGSALEIPSPTPVPTFIPATVQTITETPAARLYVVTAEVLEVRDGAGEKFLNVGYLSKGDTVTVYIVNRNILEKCSAWANIGGGRWVCFDRLEHE